MKKSGLAGQDIPPVGFYETSTIDMKQDKSLAFILNAIAIAIAAVMVNFGMYMAPIENDLMDIGVARGLYLKYVVVFILTIAYMFLHELTHGLFIHIFSRKKASYGFTGIYACAGSHECFGRIEYGVIAMAPVVVLGTLITMASLAFPREYFWMFYFLQTVNMSGAVGDYYVVLKIPSFQDGSLIRDTGTAVSIFSPIKAYAPVVSRDSAKVPEVSIKTGY